MPSETFDNLPPEKRSRIVEAAIDEFSARPYGEASLNRIVRAAGISKGSLYQYFDDKADLFHWLVLEETGRRKLACIASTPVQGEGLYAELERAIRGGLAFAAQEPRIARIAAKLMDPTVHPDLADLVERSRELGHLWMMDLLRAARERGDVHADVELAVASRFLIPVLGQGLLDVLLHELDVDLPTFLGDPEIRDRLSDDDLDRLVTQCVGFVRFGLMGGGR